MVRQNELVTGLVVGATVGAVAEFLFLASRTGDIRQKAARFINAIRIRGKHKDGRPALVGPFEWRDVQFPA